MKTFDGDEDTGIDEAEWESRVRQELVDMNYNSSGMGLSRITMRFTGAEDLLEALEELYASKDITVKGKRLPRLVDYAKAQLRKKWDKQTRANIALYCKGSSVRTEAAHRAGYLKRDSIETPKP